MYSRAIHAVDIIVRYNEMDMADMLEIFSIAQHTHTHTHIISINRMTWHTLYRISAPGRTIKKFVFLVK